MNSPAADLKALLLDNEQAYYWMGFIAADGYINHSVWRLKIELASRDKSHLQKLAEFISYRGLFESRISVQDKKTLPALCNKFNLKPRKTYNPPSVDWMSNELFVPFFVGFVDGDGSIGYQYGRSDCLLRLQIHQNWLPCLSTMQQKLMILSGIAIPEPYKNNRGYAVLTSGNHTFLKWLKHRTAHLPVLNRKWNKIDLDYNTLYERSKEHEVNVAVMLSEGWPQIKIAEQLNLTKSAISRIVKRLRCKDE